MLNGRRLSDQARSRTAIRFKSAAPCSTHNFPTDAPPVFEVGAASAG